MDSECSIISPTILLSSTGERNLWNWTCTCPDESAFLLFCLFIFIKMNNMTWRYWSIITEQFKWLICYKMNLLWTFVSQLQMTNSNSWQVRLRTGRGRGQWADAFVTIATWTAESVLEQKGIPQSIKATPACDGFDVTIGMWWHHSQSLHEIQDLHFRTVIHRLRPEYPHRTQFLNSRDRRLSIYRE